MKNRLIGLLAIILSVVLVSGCRPPGNETAISTPTAFTQKVLVEEYTGTWCGFCPDGAYRMQQLIDANPGIVYGAAYHDGDSMEVGEHTELENGIGGCPFYPSGAVNRRTFASSSTLIMGREYWTTAMNQALAVPATCGLRLTSSVSGSTATIEVSAGFSQQLGAETRLAVLMVEDNVTMTAAADYQHNYYDTTLGSPFFGRGNPIPDYVHMHVVRDYVTPVFGTIIDAKYTSAGSGISRTFTWTIPSGVKSQDLKVIAVLNAFGPNPADKTILNVQKATLGETQDWD